MNIMDKGRSRMMLALSLLLSLLTVADACRCDFHKHPEIHMQNIYCSKEYILVGRILHRDEVNVSISEDDQSRKRLMAKYTVKVLHSFKDNLRVGSKFEFYTPTSGSICGFSYKIGAIEYLIMGKDKTVQYCDLTLRKPTTAAQMLYFFTKRGYRRSCQCQIKDNMYKDPDPALSCKFPEEGFNYCYDSHAYCVRSRSGCLWQNEEGCKAEN